MSDVRGVTLIEALVSAAVLSILSIAVGQQFIFQKRFSVRQKNLDAEAMMVQSLMDQVRNRIEIYPKVYSPISLSDYPSDLTALVQKLEENGGAGWPLAWSQDFLGPVKDCTSCAGRAIYLIQQQKVCSNVSVCKSDVTGDLTQYYQGIYQVRLVLFNKTVFTSAPYAHEYYFTVGSR